MSRATSPRILVFVGPSLDEGAVRGVLPFALILPPARCGDIVHALRLSPDAIVLIDGYFEQTPAVWHKELLLALERGVHVFGGGSMGALRAAELERFGMFGVGAIFEAFASGELRDDDEVAVSHGPAAFGYPPFSTPMVDIRSSVCAAVAAGTIADRAAAATVDAARRQPYWKRAAALPPQVLAVPQKQADAIAVLRRVAASAPSLVERSATLLSVERSLGLRTLYRDMMCRPFPSFHDWLPEPERVARTARLLGGDYRAARRAAHLVACLAALHGSLERALEALPSDQEVRPDYISLVGWEDECEGRIARVVARCWQALDTEAERCGLIPADDEVVAAAQYLRRKLGLLTSAELERWFARAGMTPDDFVRSAAIRATYESLVMRNAIGAMGLSNLPEGIFWLEHGLRLTEVFGEARRVLRGEAGDALSARVRATLLNACLDERFAYEHDFEGSEEAYDEASRLGVTVTRSEVHHEDHLHRARFDGDRDP